MRSLPELADDLGLPPETVRPYGRQVGKVPVAAVRAQVAQGRRGKLILVTGITPTSHGEGKTVTAIGAAMALRASGRRAVAVLRQPSLGPVFGAKGGASGGGRATVEPATEVDLGLTGDLDAVTAAHDLLAALVDNHLFHGNALQLDRTGGTWPRALDVEDRALRHIVTSVGGPPAEIARSSGFVITAASEVTAILGLASDYADLKRRLGRILVGRSGGTGAVRASDVGAVGAMAALLRHAMEPNLLQAADGTPALVHGGPFANIAHGTATRLAIELGLYSADYCLVEAGFATDLGAEKFVDILGRDPDLHVDAGILVATVRALRHQGGTAPNALDRADPEAVERGLPNLEQHLENLRLLGIETVVALNRFPEDDPHEIALIRRTVEGASAVLVESTAYAQGASGARDLAEAVVGRAGRGRQSEPLYPLGTPVRAAVDLVARQIYGARETASSPEVDEALAYLESIGEGSGPVCIAKTPFSLSDDPHRRGRPRDYACTICRVSRSAGAGFTVAYLGAIETMPGLPVRPLAERIDLTDNGEVTGLH